MKKPQAETKKETIHAHRIEIWYWRHFCTFTKNFKFIVLHASQIFQTNTQSRKNKGISLRKVSSLCYRFLKCTVSKNPEF